MLPGKDDNFVANFEWPSLNPCGKPREEDAPDEDDPENQAKESRQDRRKENPESDAEIRDKPSLIVQGKKHQRDCCDNAESHGEGRCIRDQIMMWCSFHLPVFTEHLNIPFHLL